MQEHKPLTQFVYESLYADVINGVLTPNDILSENALTERFSVSKSPVREALVSLCDDGVLRSIPRVGYKVVQITPAEVRHLEEARCALETFMLRRSFPSIGQREIVLLQQGESEGQVARFQRRDEADVVAPVHVPVRVLARKMLARGLRAVAQRPVQQAAHVRVARVAGQLQVKAAVAPPGLVARSRGADV